MLSFAADNSIPFSTIPKLIEMTKVLSSDQTALSEIKVSKNQLAISYALVKL